MLDLASAKIPLLLLKRLAQLSTIVARLGAEQVHDIRQGEGAWESISTFQPLKHSKAAAMLVQAEADLLHEVSMEGRVTPVLARRRRILFARLQSYFAMVVDAVRQNPARIALLEEVYKDYAVPHRQRYLACTRSIMNVDEEGFRDLVANADSIAGL